MKIYTFIFVLIFVIKISAQEKIDSLSKGKNQIGLYLSNVDHFSGIFYDYKTFSAGVNYSRKISKRIRLDGGIFFDKEKEYITGYVITNKPGIINPSDYDTTYNFEIRRHLIEIPLKLKYNFVPREKINFFFFGGLVLRNYFQDRTQTTQVIASSGKSTTYDWHHYRPSDANKIYFGITAGFAFDYRFSPAWTVSIQPEFRCQLVDSQYYDFFEFAYTLNDSLAISYNF